MYFSVKNLKNTEYYRKVVVNDQKFFLQKKMSRG